MIVGGSVDCMLDNRVSADRGTRVLALEAGRSDYRAAESTLGRVGMGRTNPAQSLAITRA